MDTHIAPVGWSVSGSNPPRANARPNGPRDYLLPEPRADPPEHDRRHLHHHRHLQLQSDAVEPPSTRSPRTDGCARLSSVERESSKSRTSSGNSVSASSKGHISSSSVDTSNWNCVLSSSPSRVSYSSCGFSSSNGGKTSKNRLTSVQFRRSLCWSGDDSRSRSRTSCAFCDRNGLETPKTGSPRRLASRKRHISN